ncbi:uncharacterized protein LOC115631289 [Scaptodrosophila lebanonensis]|uniref:Uncharacterized protein LOC115631289 n=1 Tax=Drosophila lebanonensis TaxID=7225 RepID=A0A6J2U8J4_DROLE|nr:uncharacterized protein LOC115631289 [Scaptodrosophila lebanonensis]
MMTHYAGACLQPIRHRLFMLLLSHVLLVTANWADDNPETTPEICVIRATLFMTPPTPPRSSEDFGLPIDINCENRSLENLSEAARGIGLQRMAGKTHVLLDGSQTPPLGVASYGLEFLDNCPSLKSVQIERFVGDTTLELSCGLEQLQQLLEVSFHNNELSTLSGLTFRNVPHLQKLQLAGNSLRHAEPLLDCKELLDLSIKQEKELLLSDGSLFGNLPQLQRLQLHSLKLIRPKLFEALPANLSELRVEETPIVERQVFIQNVSQLVNASIVHCQLLSFTASAPALRVLNLSGNSLEHLELLGAPNLLSLDLSENTLETLNISWFVALTQLQHLYLRKNQLKTLSLSQLLTTAPHILQRLDLRDNLLQALQETQELSLESFPQLRVQIDGNAWSCQWLLNFTHAQPQMFRIFQYAKYISQINVNGLSCQPQQPEPPVDSIMSDPPPATVDHSDLSLNETRPNVSTFTVLFGSPVEHKRSQRSGALIIVFMLPVGIAALFLLLYLYLHCERLFHLSYYMSSMHCFGNKSEAPKRFVDHVDVVRYPASNDNGDVAKGLSSVEDQQPDGYETPLTGAGSICNCAHRQSSCSRKHHVTYETLPTELPYQVYAEIKEDPADPSEEIHLPTAPIYDHLSFEEKPSQLDI